jgi:hypothetical protein
MKKLFLLLIALTSVTIYAQEPEKIKGSVWMGFGQAKKIYKSPNLDQEIKKHKIIAILPFKTKIQYKNLPKDYNEQENKNQELDLAFNLQYTLYANISIRKKEYSVDVQNSETTNEILKANNIYDNIQNFTPNQIAKILGVDAVIYCTYVYTKVGTKAEAIAVNLLVGSRTKVATGELTMTVYNGIDDELLWSFNKIMDQEVHSSPNDVITRMMDKIAWNFPYKKE